MNSPMVPCTCCRGRGRYMGNGLLERDCDICNKTGLIEDKTINNIPQEIEQPLSLDDVVEVKRKRGRPKKGGQ